MINRTTPLRVRAPWADVIAVALIGAALAASTLLLCDWIWQAVQPGSTPLDWTGWPLFAVAFTGGWFGARVRKGQADE